MVAIEAGRAALSKEPESPNLTPRQKDALNLMARGLSGTEKIIQIKK